MADVPWQPPTENFNEQTKFDGDVRAVSVIQSLDRMTHQGFSFYGFASEADIPDGARRYLLMRTGPTLPPHFKTVEISASEGPVNVNIYERVGSPQLDITTMSPQPNILKLFNANRNSSNVSQSVVYGLGDAAPASPLGELILGNVFIPANGNAGVIGTSKVSELVMLPSTDYIMEIQNDPLGGGTASISLFFQYFETPWCECAQ